MTGTLRPMSLGGITRCSAQSSPWHRPSSTLFYYDQRIRLEGFDIERMMETAGLNVPVTPLGEAGTAAAPPPEEELA